MNVRPRRKPGAFALAAYDARGWLRFATPSKSAVLPSPKIVKVTIKELAYNRLPRRRHIMSDPNP